MGIDGGKSQNYKRSTEWSGEMRLTGKTAAPAPEQVDGILPLPTAALGLAATTLVDRVEAGLLTVGATVDFALVVINALVVVTALLVSAGMAKRLLETQVSKLGLRAAFKSWYHLPNAW